MSQNQRHQSYRITVGGKLVKVSNIPVHVKIPAFALLLNLNEFFLGPWNDYSTFSVASHPYPIYEVIQMDPVSSNGISAVLFLTSWTSRLQPLTWTNWEWSWPSCQTSRPSTWVCPRRGPSNRTTTATEPAGPAGEQTGGGVARRVLVLGGWEPSDRFGLLHSG